MIVADIMPPFLKPVFCLVPKDLSEWLGALGVVARINAGVPVVHQNVTMLMEDAQAETADTAAALDAGASAGESSGASAQRALPPALLQRRPDKAKSDAETAIKEKEAMQKQNG
jgi:hypothetical protein